MPQQSLDLLGMTGRIVLCRWGYHSSIPDIRAAGNDGSAEKGCSAWWAHGSHGTVGLVAQPGQMDDDINRDASARLKSLSCHLGHAAPD